MAEKSVKQSVYMPEEMLREIRDEADRLDRSLAWVVQKAWKMSRERMRQLHAPSDPEEKG